MISASEKIKKVMVPLAFTPLSPDLVRYALVLATTMDLQKIIFIHVINQRDVEAVETIASFGYDVDTNEYVEEIKRNRLAELQNMLKGANFPEERMKMIIEVGKPAETILSAAEQEGVAMIVMGVRTRGDILSAFTGSVAEKLFRHSPIPILSYGP